MRYRTEIDGLRGIAVAAVVFYHAGVPGFAAGFVGVDVFFVLSGYLMAALLREEGERHGRIDLPRFLIRRARRLLPLLLVVCLATTIAALFVLLPHQLKDFGQSLALTPSFLSNWLFWHEAGYFGTASEVKPLLHGWSLAVEGQFYLCIAVLGACCVARGGGLPGWVAILSLLSFGANIVAATAWPQAAFYLLPFRLWEFGVGALIALLPAEPRLRSLGWLGAALLALSAVAITGAAPFPGVIGVLPVLGTGLILMSRGPVIHALRWGALRGLGRISYGVYLWHVPFFVLGGIAMPDLPALAWVPVVLVIAGLTCRWVEVPFRRGRWPAIGPILGAGATAVMIGLTLHLTSGLPARLPDVARTPLAHHEAWAMPCHGQLSVSAVKRGAVCRIGAEGVTPTIALLGDSHAGHLTPALTQDLAQQGAAALVFSRGWCAPLPGFGTDAPSRGPECAAFMEAAWRHVLTHPDIETIVLAAQWANFTEGTREGMARVTYADALDWRGNPAAFSAAMANLAETLHGKGRRLVLVEPVPEFAEPVPDALMRDAWREKTLTRVAPPVPFEGRNAPALATLAAFREETRALVLRPRDILCEKVDLCRVATEAGVPLYRDRGHLSSAGAALISEALVPLLKIR